MSHKTLRPKAKYTDPYDPGTFSQCGELYKPQNFTPAKCLKPKEKTPLDKI